MAKVEIVQNPDNEVPAKIIAESIVRIDNAVKALLTSGLSMKAIVVLLQNLSGESQRSVRNVLYALNNLKSEFIQSPKSKR